MMGGYHGFMGGYGGSYGSFSILSIVGLVSGAIVVIGALMLRMQPQEHLTWGILILVFSIISFAGMGGYFIGALLGIIGGALALSYRPRMTQTEKASPQS